MKKFHIVFIALIGVIIVLFLGGMFNFYPFLGTDLIVREVQFCTFLICLVMIICTCIIETLFCFCRSLLPLTAVISIV